MNPAAVAYVPVVHRGYKQFFSSCVSMGAKTLYILGKPFTDAFPELERDLRALDPEEIKAMVQTLHLFCSVKILDGTNAGELRLAPRIFLPDECVSRDFAAQQLSPGKAEFLSIFLRWDKRALFTKRPPARHRTCSVTEFDREMMYLAHQEAARSPDWWRQIAAVVVKDGQVLQSAHNEHFPAEQTTYVNGDPRSNFKSGEQNEFYCSLHSEKSVIAQAARENGGLDGASLFVTVFPCPGCARMIARAGIARVYYAEGYSIFDADQILVKNGVEIIHVPLD